MSLHSSSPLALLAALLLTACDDQRDQATADSGMLPELPWDQGGADTPEYSLGRLLVSDRKRELVTAFDLDTNSVAGTLPFAAGTRVFPGATGRYAYVYAEGALRVVDPGQWLLSHIDHFHIVRSDLSLLEPQLSLSSLSSFAAHEGWLTAFDAEAGSATFFQERSITAQQFAPQLVGLGRPHTGVALVANAQLVASYAGADGTVPVLSVASVMATEARTLHAGCSEPKGWAATRTSVALACVEGVQLLRWNQASQGFDPQLLGYAASQTRAQRVRASFKHDWFVTDAGDRELQRIEGGGERVASTRFDADILAFEIRRQDSAVIVLTRDGVLHDLEPDQLGTRSTLSLLEPVPVDAAPPALALSHAYAYLADARSPELWAVRLRSFALEQRLTVGGAPYELAVVGLPYTYTDSRE